MHKDKMMIAIDMKGMIENIMLITSAGAICSGEFEPMRKTYNP